MFPHYFAGYQRVYPQHRHSNQSNSNLSHLKHTSERRVWVPFGVDISCVHLFILSCFRYIYIFAHLFQTENGRLHIIYGLSLWYRSVRPSACIISISKSERTFLHLYVSCAFVAGIPWHDSTTAYRKSKGILTHSVVYLMAPWTTYSCRYTAYMPPPLLHGCWEWWPLCLSSTQQHHTLTLAVRFFVPRVCVFVCQLFDWWQEFFL